MCASAFDEQILHIANIGCSTYTVSVCSCRCRCFYYTATTRYCFAVVMCFLLPRAAFARFLSLTLSLSLTYLLIYSRSLSVCLLCVWVFFLKFHNQSGGGKENGGLRNYKRTGEEGKEHLFFGKFYLPCCWWCLCQASLAVLFSIQLNLYSSSFGCKKFNLN